MKEVLLVFLGSGIGGSVRYLISTLCKSNDNNLPIHTLITNAIACLILGIIVSKIDASNSTLKYIVSIGFCGGLSTYSTYTLESFNMMNNGNFINMIIYSIITLTICLISIYAGLYLGK